MYRVASLLQTNRCGNVCFVLSSCQVRRCSKSWRSSGSSTWDSSSPSSTPTSSSSTSTPLTRNITLRCCSSTRCSRDRDSLCEDVNYNILSWEYILLGFLSLIFHICVFAAPRSFTSPPSTKAFSWKTLIFSERMALSSSLMRTVRIFKLRSNRPGAAQCCLQVSNLNFDFVL